MGDKVKLWCTVIVLIGIIAVIMVLEIELRYSRTTFFDDGEIFWGRYILKNVPLIDGHNDLPMNLYKLERNQINNFDFSNLEEHPVWGPFAYSQTDGYRIEQSSLGSQFWVARVECQTTQYKDSVERTLEQLDVMKRLIAKYPKYMNYTTTAQGILDNFTKRYYFYSIGSLLAIEGGHAIDSRLAVLRMYYELGVRYLTLTHTCNVPWADSSSIDVNEEAVKINLTDFGKVIVLEMNRLGMMVDLSQSSHGVMSDVLDISRAPIIFSHANSFTVHGDHRNVRDDILERLPSNGGIIMVTFYQAVVGGSSVWDVIDHLNHIKSITGPDHIGIGGDYDGVEEVPTGLEDVSKYPDLFDLLAEPGHGYKPWTREELKKLAGENLIRVLMEAEMVRDKLENEPPIEDLISEVDLYEAANQTCRSDFTFLPHSKSLSRANYYIDEIDGC